MAAARMVRVRGAGAHDSLQNTKPSAIFRIRDPHRDTATGAAPSTATLGISVETLDLVEREMQTLGRSSAAPPSSALALASRTNPDTLLAQAAQLAAPIGA